MARGGIALAGRVLFVLFQTPEVDKPQPIPNDSGTMNAAPRTVELGYRLGDITRLLLLLAIQRCGQR